MRRHVATSIYSICVHRRAYSILFSDKIHFPQLCIKCGVAKSCPGTHTGQQAPMEWAAYIYINDTSFNAIYAQMRCVCAIKSHSQCVYLLTNIDPVNTNQKLDYSKQALGGG